MGLLTFTLSQASAQEQGLHYFAVENTESMVVEQRGTAGSAGVAFSNLRLAPLTRYRIWLLQARTLRVARVTVTTPGVGASIELPPFRLQLANPHDPDGDGLPGAAEFVVGTSQTNPDTDGDGVPDGAEVLAGDDPLSNLPATVGIIAAADTPGSAVDVCAVNDMALVADYDRGLTVFNVFNTLNPAIVAQVDTDGIAVRVACSPNNRVAVVDRHGGLKVVDLSDPPAAQISHVFSRFLLGGDTSAVDVAADVAFTGLATGQLVSLDMAGGIVLDRIQLDGAVRDVSVRGDYVYALTSFGTLYVLALTPSDLQILGQITPPLPAAPQRLVIGDVAYVVTGFGYATLNITDPANPTLIQANARETGMLDLAENGSGLSLIPEISAQGLSLYDTSDPQVSDNYLTTIGTPGAFLAREPEGMRGVSLFNGQAYYADANAGLQVINYLGVDTAGIAPTISLSSNFGLNQLEEGKLARVTADVGDDVQVRNVEFYLDGRRATVDGNFPFEFHYVAPRIADQTFQTLRARVFDTGGNFTWSDLIAIQLTSDQTAPFVTGVLPRDGAYVGTAGSVGVFVSEPLDPASLSQLTLVEAGPDLALGTTDDVTVAGGVVEFRDEVQGAFLVFAGGLPAGRYRATTGTLTDLAGAPLGTPTTWDFTVAIGSGAVDSDGDGLPDDLELSLGLDPNDTDSDNDTIPDGEEDLDGDGLSNLAELSFGTDPANPDSDGNGTADGDEDADGEGLSNALEVANNTDPFFHDTDRDGFNDREEVQAPSSPTDPNSLPIFTVIQQTSTFNSVSPARSLGRVLAKASAFNGVGQLQVFARTSGQNLLSRETLEQRETSPAVVIQNTSPTAPPETRYRFELNFAGGLGGVDEAPAPDGFDGRKIGEVITLTAVPSPGFYFVEWTQTPGNPTSVSPLVVTMDQGRSVVANFAPKITLTITTSGAGFGSVSESPINVDGYPPGTEVTLTATPAVGSQFTGWSGNVTSTDNPLTITITANTNLTATFEPN